MRSRRKRIPHGPSGGTERVYRGGDWNNAAVDCRYASRNFAGHAHSDEEGDDPAPRV
jgi:hypothetical protein